MLRREWRFGGLTVSDYTGDQEKIAHGFAADARVATRIAIMAGVDTSMASGLYREHLPTLVQAGEVSIARVDEAVRRVLEAKARLGLFDDPFLQIDPARERARSRTRPTLALAREAARRSVVMLKNEGGCAAAANAGSAHRADRAVRGRSARSDRTVKRVWGRRAGDRSGDGVAHSDGACGTT